MQELGSLEMGHTVVSVQRNRTRGSIELLNGDVADMDARDGRHRV